MPLSNISLNNKSSKAENALLLLIFSILILAYVLPVWINPAPSGTDVYSHIFYTELMEETNSLSDFYDAALSQGYNSFDYPFGLWLYGAIISKMTGMDVYTISYILPVLLVFALTVLFYEYSKLFLQKKTDRLISLGFLLSMPLLSTTLLEYRTSVLSMLPLLAVYYYILSPKHPPKKAALILCMLLFTLCFTHTGTFIFLLFFLILFFLTYALISGKLDRKTYFTIAAMFFIYIATTDIFGYIHPQYIDKARLVLMVGDFLSSTLHISIAQESTTSLYQRVFIERSVFDAVVWCGFIYTGGMLLVYINQKLTSHLRRKKPSSASALPAIPILSNIKNISHSIFSLPIWIGPFHTILTLVGLPRLNNTEKAFLFSALAVTVLPGGIVVTATGSLREIFYLFVIIPISSAIGYSMAEGSIRKLRGPVGATAECVFLIGVLSSMTVMPVIGNIYYSPPISGSPNEKTGLSWLGTVGNDSEGASGEGYRHMISVYSGKQVPEVTTVYSGNEMRGFINNLKNIYFFNNSEKAYTPCTPISA